MLAWLMVFVCAQSEALDVEQKAQSLVKLRHQLEVSHRELESFQKERQLELDLWVQKRLEAEAQLSKETARGLQITEKMARIQERVRSADRAADTATKRRVVSWIEQLEWHVQHSIPFRHEARLSQLRDLKERAQRGLESYESLAAELWQLVESEFKLALESEYRIHDQRETAHLGAFALIEREASGKYFATTRQNETWVRRELSTQDEAQSAQKTLSDLKQKKFTSVHDLKFLESL